MNLWQHWKLHNAIRNAGRFAPGEERRCWVCGRGWLAPWSYDFRDRNLSLIKLDKDRREVKK